MKAYVSPQQRLSRAMDRAGDALARHAPEWVEIVKDPAQADVQLLHVTGDGQAALSHLKAPRYAVAQYCYLTAANRQSLPWGLWADAELVWSYLPDLPDLPDVISGPFLDPGSAPPFYHSPLGIDPEFTQEIHSPERAIGCITSGYVTGPDAEAIEEVAEVCQVLGLRVLHIGPSDIQGWGKTSRRLWSNEHGISDRSLAAAYSSSLWVSGLRHVEGFEIPVIEGLACGARPIVFDRPDMRQWYDGHAVFVPECSGQELVERLIAIMSETPEPVTETERQEVMRKFDWATIAAGFWDRLAEAMS